MHDCPECGEECGCDGEDHHQDAPDDCSHYCNHEDLEDLEDLDDEDDDDYAAGACPHGVSAQLSCPYCHA